MWSWPDCCLRPENLPLGIWRAVTVLWVVTLGDGTREDSLRSPDQTLGIALPAAEFPVFQVTHGGGVWTGQCLHVPVSAGLLGPRSPSSPLSTLPAPSLATLLLQNPPLGAGLTSGPWGLGSPSVTYGATHGMMPTPRLPGASLEQPVVCGARDACRGLSHLSAVARDGTGVCTTRGRHCAVTLTSGPLLTAAGPRRACWVWGPSCKVLVW